MTRQTRLSLALALTVLAAVGVAAQQPSSAPKPRRIAVFGSSVAFGNGDEAGKEGYTGRLREMLKPTGWEVFNQSRGGDNTKTIAPRFEPAGAPDPNIRYLLPVNPSYVVIALSLGNEGIAAATAGAGKDAIFAQFEAGLHALIDRSRQHGITPIVTLCYTRQDFTDVEYAYTKRMNLLINSWDVPSVNFLGAVDDGTGKWVNGFWTDPLHPNTAGHEELATTFVPTLFEALEQGKPMPTKSTAPGFARATAAGAPVVFTVDAQSRMHPFTLGLTARAHEDGVVASIRGYALSASTAPKTVGAGREIQSTSLTRSERVIDSWIGVHNGVWTYFPSGGGVVESGVRADDAWHDVLISHYEARGETLFFVDGRLVGGAREHYEPTAFFVGGEVPIEGFPIKGSDANGHVIDMRDLLIYRSALNPDEVAALHDGRLLQASLEVYAPLRDEFVTGAPVANLAQSLSTPRASYTTLKHVKN